MATIRNEDQLRRLLQPKLQKAVHYVMNKILEANAEAIQNIVYGAGTPDLYNRTGEFAKAWAITDENHNPTTNDAYGKFYYKPNEMSTGSTDRDSDSYGQHVSIVDGMASREYLADIIYDGIKHSAWGDTSHWSHKKRNAWEKLLSVVGVNNMKNWIEQGMKQAGLKVKRLGGKPQVTDF